MEEGGNALFDGGLGSGLLTALGPLDNAEENSQRLASPFLAS